MKKILCIVISVIFAVTFLVACGNNDTPATPDAPDVEAEAGEDEDVEAPAPTGDGVTITFWNGFTASDGDILREIVNRYNENNAYGNYVDMDIMPWGVMLDTLAPAIATQTGPTMILLGEGGVPEYAPTGGFIPMDEFWDWSGLDRNNFLENVRNTFVLDGVTWGIPMQFNTMYLYWNKDHFIEAGLDPEHPPATFSELREFAEILTDPDQNRFGFGVALGAGNITNFLWSAGGDWLTPDQSRSEANSPALIEVLTMLQGFFNDGISPIGQEGWDLDNLLFAQTISMYINGPWLINGAREHGLNFGIGAVPAADNGNRVVPAGGVSYMITTSADEAQKIAAFDYIRYWLSDEVLTEWTIRNGFPAWSESVLALSEIQNDPIQQVLAPLSEYGRTPFLGMDIRGQLEGDVLSPLFEQLMYNQITPEDAAQQMEDGLNAILGAQ